MLKMSYFPEILISELSNKILLPKSKGQNLEFIARPASFSLLSKGKMNRNMK